MRRHGDTIHTEGSYRIIELLEVYADGTKSVLGYNLFGPGADSTWLNTLEQAHFKLAELLAQSHSRNGRAAP